MLYKLKYYFFYILVFFTTERIKMYYLSNILYCRCSVFLIDKETKELVAEVFDGISTNNKEVQCAIEVLLYLFIGQFMIKAFNL